MSQKVMGVIYTKGCNNLITIMLEINKRVYLNNVNDYNKLKHCIEEYYEKIKTF